MKCPNCDSMLREEATGCWCGWKPQPKPKPRVTVNPNIRPRDWLELSHEKFQREHDLYKRPNESSRDFARRCMAAAGAQLKKDGSFSMPDLSMNRKR